MQIIPTLQRGNDSILILINNLDKMGRYFCMS